MTVQVIGAGLAGLAAATWLAERGCEVMVHEAAPVAGGRCRSFFDPQLDRVLDNGNHLMLGAYSATLAYLDRIEAPAAARAWLPPRFSMMEPAAELAWTVEPGKLSVPEGKRWRLALDLLRLATGGRRTVGGRIGHGPWSRRLWTPLCLAMLNTPPQAASAHVLWRALRLTLLAGKQAARPLTAPLGLSALLIDPALRRLEGKLRFGHRLTGLGFEGKQIERLEFDNERLALGTDRVILTVPLPDVVPRAPEHFHAIVNVHYRLDEPARLPGDAPFLGLVGATAHWLFARDDVLSVTVSAADALVHYPPEEIAERLWREIAPLIGRSRLPLYRVIKERRATFAQSPEQAAHRPGTRTGWTNLFLAGDWTATGLPATIEGAIRSGIAAARLAAD